MQKRMLVFAITFIFLFAAALPAMRAAAAGAGFSANAVLPENQREGTTGYFDLRVRPGEKQVLAVVVDNSNSEDIVVAVEAVTASTNRNGVINYTSKGTSDESLRYSFEEMADVSESRTVIPANSSKEVTVAVNMPEEEFDGIVLGSIRVLKELTDEEKNSGQSILNQYAYVIPVRISQNDTEVEPDFLLGEVKAQLTNHRASIVANIRNPQPKLVKEVKATAKIYPRGSSDAIFEYTKEAADFAPNSVFPFSLVDEEGFGINAGFYRAEIQLQYGGRTWNFEQEFEIKAEEAAAMNQNALNQQTQRQQTAANMSAGIPWWAIVLIVSGVAVLILVVIMLMRKSKSDREAYELLRQMQELQQQRLGQAPQKAEGQTENTPPQD